jgi:hypothetical protein
MVFKASFFLLVTALVTFKGSLGQYPSMMYSPSRVMNDFQISWNNYGYYTRFTMTGPMDDFQGSSEGWMSIGVNNSTSMVCLFFYYTKQTNKGRELSIIFTNQKSGLNAVTCHFSFKENDNTSANFLIDHAYFTSESTPTYYFNEQIVWSKFIKIVNNVFMCTFYRLNDYTFWDSNYIKVNDGIMLSS